jgi:hypothetical protein
MVLVEPLPCQGGFLFRSERLLPAPAVKADFYLAVFRFWPEPLLKGGEFL